jgi:DNA-binding transcriptional regulator YhcF (GntR family)
MSARPTRRPPGPTGHPMPDVTWLVTNKGHNRYAVVTLQMVAEAGRIQGFSKSHHLVLMTILAHMNRQRGYAWPSYSRIGVIINRSPETVRRAVRDLHKWGFIKREERRGESNRYYQNFQEIGESDWKEEPQFGYPNL